MVPEEINLNYVKKLHILQTFAKAADGSRLKTSDELTTVMEIIPGTPQIYLNRKIAFSGHNFDRPADADSIFRRVGASYTLPDAESRDSIFWDTHRTLPQQDGERNIDILMGRLRRGHHGVEKQGVCLGLWIDRKSVV